jgi:hypothetical protein
MADHDGRPGADEYAPYYERYIARVPAGGVVAVLARQVAGTRALLAGVPDALADHAYAPGKWTVKEVVGHIVDAERVFAYRALRFARGDATELAGFDENAYVPAGRFGERTLASLAEELESVRQATVRLLAGLPAEAWLRRGVANGQAVSVRALACIIAGHELHHRAILEERYLVRPTTGT